MHRLDDARANMRSNHAFALLTILVATLSLAGCGGGSGATPSQAEVEAALKKTWDRPAAGSTPKSVVTLNSVKFGKGYKATVQEVQVDGLPEGEWVTPVVIDFTQRSYYNSSTEAVKRVREAKVYKDKFSEWAVMISSALGADQSTSEPAQP